MIICPNCKEEIDDDSRFCDQCGQALLYCSSCGRVGLGHRCTHCGGLMISYDELQKKREERNNMTSLSTSFFSQSVSIGQATKGNMETIPNDVPQIKGMPMLLLYNSSLAIRIVGVNGAVIGRRQGPYAKFFSNNMYVSGVHAQLLFKQDSGWCVIDKHSSNGTKLNQRDLLPDVPMSVKNGDILTIANVSLQVSIK